MKKKISSTLIPLVVILSLLFLLSANENEPNNSSQTANSININEVCTGALSVQGDVDWYTFSLNSAGKVSITFRMQMKGNNNNYYEIYVYPATNPDSPLLWQIVNGYATESIMPSLGLPAGRYYVRIQRSDTYPWTYSAADYSFIVNYAQDDNWEKEFNNSWPTSTEILLRQRYYGSLARSQDVDWYAFTLNNAGKVNITFWSDMMINNNNYYEIYVYHAANPDRQLFGQIVSGYTTEAGMPSLGLPAGKYYIRIQRSDTYPWTYSYADYSFIVQ